MQHLEDFAYAVGVNSGSTPGAVFRRPLTDFEDVPDLIFNAIMFLDKHALYAQGLFRVPVSSALRFHAFWIAFGVNPWHSGKRGHNCGLEEKLR